ncbi:MAG: subclass B3 metallo-beta-lactamase [Mucilaginibacter sp.]
MIYCLGSDAQKLVKPPLSQPDWSREYAPFRIVGNLYYVGTYDLACYLVTTPKGNILINTGLPGSETMIRQHIEALGFKFKDIKILLNNQAHFDHVGAMAAIKKMTGAKIMINESDAEVLADGGNSDFVMGGKGMLFAPVKADILLHKNDTVRFGGMQIAALYHPGHTKGSTGFLFNIKDQGRTYKVFIANLPTILDQTKLASMPGYPNVGKDYAYTLNAMKNIRFDIWLAAHAGQFNLHQKRQPGAAYNPNAFIDQQGYITALNDLQKAYEKKLNQK